MEAIGGGRGIIGVLVATGVVALPIGLVVADTLAKNWQPIGSDLGKAATVIVLWLLAIVWAFGGRFPVGR
jgi:hypothetical protein